MYNNMNKLFLIVSNLNINLYRAVKFIMNFSLTIRYFLNEFLKPNKITSMRNLYYRLAAN